VTVNEAVYALRKHVGKTQQIFATELGISISSLNNYERQRGPEPKQLFRFERAAIDAGRLDLAQIFRAALEKSLGVEHGETAIFQSKDRFETRAISKLLSCIRGNTAAAPSVIGAIAAGEPKWFIDEAIRRGLF
jgi:transcriptional regulator with XRE-family HTH domain